MPRKKMPLDLHAIFSEKREFWFSFAVFTFGALYPNALAFVIGLVLMIGFSRVYKYWEME